MSETTTRPASYKVGDVVVVDGIGWPAQYRGRAFRITKVPVGARGVNYTAEPVDGSGRGIKAAAYQLLPNGHPTEVNLPPTVLPAYVPLPEVGAVVAVKGIRNLDAHTLYVVQGAARNHFDAVKLVRLGGEGGRYWPAIPVKNVEVIPVSEIPAFLLGTR